MRNTDHRSGDYSEMAKLYRPNHADFTYDRRYGLHDARGGGRASARETLNWVIGGAIARQIPCMRDIHINAKVVEIGGVRGSEEELNAVVAEAMKRGDSVGAIVECVIEGVPAGKGNPVFGKLHARLAAAMMSINAVKGFEYGDGFSAAAMYGTEHADIFTTKDGRIITETNHSGGIQGGISNGMPITFRVAFKPTPTLLQDIRTVDTEGHEALLRGRGRHDACVALRGVPVVEAMAALTICDELLV